MKTETMKKCILLNIKVIRFCVATLLLAVSIATNAYDFEATNSDGVTIYYNKSGSRATVTFESPDFNLYSGSITIPETVTFEGTTYTVIAISSNAFKGCKGLTQVVIPNSIISIGGNAFQNCKRLTEVNIPNSVASMGMFAFDGCTGLKRVTIGDGLEEVDMCAFYGCTSLTEVIIGESVTKIANDAFNKCKGLTKVTFGENVEYIGYRAFQECTGLTEVSIPNSVNVICGNAFEDCTSLTKVTIGNGVETIGEGAFASCTALKQLTIGNSVTEIGDAAFAYCTSLTSIGSLNSKPPTCYSDVFYDVPSRACVLSVPEGSKGAYSSVYGWNSFTNIVVQGKQEAQVLSGGGSAEEDDRIYDMPEESAEFPGDVYDWLDKNIEYPAVCKKNGVQGRVTVQFVINKDGSLTDVKILRSPDDKLSKEAERVVKSMPKWQPALQKGRAVRMLYVLPVMFRIKE